MPSELSRIRSVRVTCVDWSRNKETWTSDYKGYVSWSDVNNCWEMFIDLSTFGNNLIEKKDFIFMDANEKEIPMEGYWFSTVELIENDCGSILIKCRGSNE